MAKTINPLFTLYKINHAVQKTASSFPLVRSLSDGLKSMLRRQQHTRLKRVFSDLSVHNGPFKGLRYPDFEANCSAIFPKLLGSYESELHSTLADWRELSFPLIIDVGCAEGYYAVGLAQMFPDTKIIAFDMDPKARKACEKLAQINHVENQVEIESECNPEKLRTFDWAKGGLIVCDCEGYEEQLFSSEIISDLSACHLLIETHDFLRPGVTQKLVDRFSQTHSIKTLISTSDQQKVETYQFPETNRMSTLTKRYATAERRPALMKWLALEPSKS